MITLRKRLSAYDRVGKVTVLDMLNDPKALEYLTKVFGGDKYLWICEQCSQGKQYWIAVDEYHKDYWLFSSFEDVLDFYKNFSKSQMYLSKKHRHSSVSAL